MQYSLRRKAFNIISLAVCVALFIILTILLWKPLTETFTNPEEFRQWISEQGFWGQFVIIGMMILQVVFALIPGGPMEVAAGYAFGAIEGTILCVIGGMIGTVIIFMFTRLFGVKMVETLISREKIASLKFLQDSRRLNFLIAIIFVIPGTPKDLITYFIGLTTIKFRTFLIISTIARIPSILISTMIGDAVGVQNYQTAVIILAITVVLCIGGYLVYYLISKKGQQQQKID